MTPQDIANANARVRANEAEARKPVVVKAPTDADIAAMVEREIKDEARARADAVLAEYGRVAPLPISGETPTAYRARLVNEARSAMQVRPLSLDGFEEEDRLSVVENRQYADAMRMARAPHFIPDGEIMEIVKADQSGRAIHEFRANGNATNNTFKNVYGHCIGPALGHGVCTQDRHGNWNPAPLPIMP